MRWGEKVKRTEKVRRAGRWMRQREGGPPGQQDGEKGRRRDRLGGGVNDGEIGWDVWTA